MLLITPFLKIKMIKTLPTGIGRQSYQPALSNPGILIEWHSDWTSNLAFELVRCTVHQPTVLGGPAFQSLLLHPSVLLTLSFIRIPFLIWNPAVLCGVWFCDKLSGSLLGGFRFGTAGCSCHLFLWNTQDPSIISALCGMEFGPQSFRLSTRLMNKMSSTQLLLDLTLLSTLRVPGIADRLSALGASDLPLHHLLPERNTSNFLWISQSKALLQPTHLDCLYSVICFLALFLP